VLGRSYAYARWLDSEAPAAPAAHHDVDVDGVNVVLAAAAMGDRVRLDTEHDPLGEPESVAQSLEPDPLECGGET
jgi:hypothetical protein